MKRKEIYLGHGLYKYVDEKSVSEQLQDELEPIIHTMSKGINAAHPTEYDESDDIEYLKKYEREPVTKKQVLAGPKRFLKNCEKNFFKGEKWEWKNEG